MASLDKELPLPPKTPSFYNRLKAMSTRTWSRSESRMSTSRDQHTSRPPSAAASRQGSISRSNDIRTDRSHSRASTMKPERMYQNVHGSTVTGQPPPSSAVHNRQQHTRQQEQQQRQQQHMQPTNHIVYQAKHQLSHGYKLDSPDRAQTTQPDVAYGHSYQNSPVMPFDYYQHFPRPQMSQNVLRRRPSIIGNYISEKHPTEVEGRPSLSLDTSLVPRASKVQNEAVPISRRTPDDLKYSVRQQARSLKTPDNPRANSRATSRAATYTSASPSSPSTTRHDTPSVFSHASRATSRTAYSPSSINAMEPHTWTTDPDAPPVPEIRSKLPRTTASQQPFVPPELAHLAYTPITQTQAVSSKSQYPRMTNTDEHYPHTGPLGFAIHSNTTGGGVSSRYSPAHELQPVVAHSSSSPRPLKSMDPTLRARVTLNTAIQPQLAETTANRSPHKPKSLVASSRQATARVKVVDVPPRSSLTSATATPRLSLDKQKPSTSHSSARPSMTQYRSPRLSIQCQGDENPMTVQSTRKSAKHERSQRASHSRAFSFSKTPLKTKSSMESLKSKFSFAQRMFTKSVDQLSCVGTVDVQQQQPIVADPVSDVNEKPSTRQSLETRRTTDSIRLRTKQALSELNLLSPSSRTSIDLPRHVNTKAKPRSSTAAPSANYTGRSSMSDLSPTSQAAQLNTQRSSQNSSSTVRGKESRVSSEGANVKDNSSRSSKSKQSRDSSSTTGQDALSPVEGQEFMRFSAMTSVRESSSSERSSDRTSAQGPRLSRLHSADSGRSTSLGSYGLFPQTKTTPPKSKVIPAKSSEHQIKDASGQESPESSATTRMVDDQHADLDLRLGALSASTAISSKVLFSPGAFQVQSSVGEKILVMDGSGEDWSLYCASLIPKADVFNAPMTSKTYTNHDELTKLRGLMNHKEIPAFDVSKPFPLPPNHFSVVAFRFPPIMEEALLRHMICEIKRILRPGGYVEIMAIDLDLAKMGSDTRRALRDHKSRLSTSNINVCLKDPTDNLPRLLTHRRFENLRWGVFSVPAAGESTEPIDKSWLTKQESESTGKITIANFRPAEVAQWWYKQCYENQDATMSIWQDQVVVRECARLQTCFKVLVCYAQKPAMVRRRTASV